MSLRTAEFAQRFIVALDTLERRGQSGVGQMVNLFSPMARLVNPMLRHVGRELTGEVGAWEFWSEYRATFREVHSHFHEVTTADRAAGLFWTTRGVDLNGTPIEYDGASLLVYEDDGLIIYFRGYFDSRDLGLRLSGLRCRGGH
jgi:hypothetical protein